MKLTAHDWVARSAVAPDVFQRWPDYQVILLAADDIDVGALAGVVDSLVEHARTTVRALESADPDPHVAQWHAAYRDFGVKPRVARVSVDALIRRAGTDGGLPRINTLVDLYNAVSIIHRVPIGGEDLDSYVGPARLVLATGDEAFHTTSNGEPVVDRPDPGEPVWVDDGGITCRRWNWRQTTRTAIHAHTRRVGFILDSLDAPDHHGARRAAEQLAELIPHMHARIIRSAES